jgi:hypothetical protein
MEEATAEMSEQKEVAIQRWENEGGKIPRRAAIPSAIGATIERRENEDGQSRHIGEVSDDSAASSCVHRCEESSFYIAQQYYATILSAIKLHPTRTMQGFADDQ